METRLVVAYTLIAIMAACAVFMIAFLTRTRRANARLHRRDQAHRRRVRAEAAPLHE